MGTCNSISAQGTKLEIEVIASGSPSSLVEVSGLKTYSGFGGSATELDATCLSSSAKRKKLGLQDFGDISFEMLMDDVDAGQIELQTAQGDKILRSFRLTLPNGKKRDWQAYVKSFDEKGGVDALVLRNCVLTIDGPVARS